MSNNVNTDEWSEMNAAILGATQCWFNTNMFNNTRTRLYIFNTIYSYCKNNGQRSGIALYMADDASIALIMDKNGWPIIDTIRISVLGYNNIKDMLQQVLSYNDVNITKDMDEYNELFNKKIVSEIVAVKLNDDSIDDKEYTYMFNSGQQPVIISSKLRLYIGEVLFSGLMPQLMKQSNQLVDLVNRQLNGEQLEFIIRNQAKELLLLLRLQQRLNLQEIVSNLPMLMNLPQYLEEGQLQNLRGQLIILQEFLKQLYPINIQTLIYESYESYKYIVDKDFDMSTFLSNINVYGDICKFKGLSERLAQELTEIIRNNGVVRQ